MAANTRKDLFEIKALVSEALPNSMYRATIQEGPEQLQGKTVLCTLNGNMRRFNIRVLPGDMILAEMSVYDLNRARVTRRLRETDNYGGNANVSGVNPIDRPEEAAAVDSVVIEPESAPESMTVETQN